MNPPLPVDPFGEALHFLRMSGVFYCRSEFSAPWGLALPAFEDCMMFHAIAAGECRLEVKGAPTHVLRQGDLALVPHGHGHRLLSKPGARTQDLFALPRELTGDRYEVLRYGGGGAPTLLICGLVRFDHPAAHDLIRLLPRVIRVDTWTSPEAEWIQSTLRFMASEARVLRPGGETVITRLADILVIQAIRSWIANDAGAQTGWLAALRDKQIGQAIALIHREPTHHWTLDMLARTVGMSRSGFAARFTQLVGEPAMQYVTRWQMRTVHMWLAEDDASIGELAGRLGYESEAAFSRAFKRFIGMSPGAARRELAASRRPSVASSISNSNSVARNRERAQSAGSR